MKYDFDKVVDRKGTFCVKWDIIPEPAPVDAISMWIADMDFPCAQPIIDALHKRADHPIFGYTYYESQELKETIVNWYKKRYGWDVAPGDIFHSPGVVPGIAVCISALSEPGDGVVIQRPVYYPFTKKIEANDRVVVNNPLIYENGRYTMDYEDLDKKLADPKNKGIILCNPHNPVGRVWLESELRQLVDIAKKYDKWIISDEIHADLLRKGVKFTPIAKASPEYKDRMIICTSLSKSFNVAGFHFSNFVIFNKEYQNQYNNILSDRMSMSGVNPFSIATCLAAYNESEDWLEQVNEYIDGNIDFCMDFFKTHLPKSLPIRVEGTFLFWVDLNGYCHGDYKKLEEAVAIKAKVSFDEGYIFGDEGKGFERINVACPRSVLEEALNKVKDAVLETFN